MYYNTVVVLGCDSYNSTVTILSSFFWAIPSGAQLRAYSLCLAQGSLLVGFGGPYGVAGIQPRSDASKASILPTQSQFL